MGRYWLLCTCYCMSSSRCRLLFDANVNWALHTLAIGLHEYLELFFNMTPIPLLNPILVLPEGPVYCNLSYDLPVVSHWIGFQQFEVDSGIGEGRQRLTMWGVRLDSSYSWRLSNLSNLFHPELTELGRGGMYRVVFEGVTHCLDITESTNNS